LNLKKLLVQQLRSYEASGLDSIPAGAGELKFNLLDPAETESVNADAGSQPNLAARNEASSPAAATEVKPRQFDQSKAQSSKAQSKGTDSSPADSGLAQRTQQLNVLQTLVADCTRCQELSANRTQTVFGVGNPAARLVFVGEGPGVDEDRQGEPFVGAAGQLLNKILDACQLSRDQIYILNVVKCRPPRNRNPSDAERSCCWGYAREQLEILQPEFICCLGSVAARSLLNTKQPLGRMRQQFHAYRGSRVIVTYHPAYLLRTPTAKRHVWDDMKLLMNAMGVDL
jgi:DNA polymerase